MLAWRYVKLSRAGTARLVLPDTYPVTEEPSPLRSARTPTARLLGRSGPIFTVSPQRDRPSPVYVPLETNFNSTNPPRKCSCHLQTP